MLKKVECFIQPLKLDEIKEALRRGHCYHQEIGPNGNYRGG